MNQQAWTEKVSVPFSALRRGSVPVIEFQNILVRATNWLGDAVMSLPALRALRRRFPRSRMTILAKPWVADLYAREPFTDRVVTYAPGALSSRLRQAWSLRAERFDSAILLQNAFDAALVALVAGIPHRIGYARDGRGLLLTNAVPVPAKGEIPRHERFYYLELLRRAGLVDELTGSDEIRLEGAPAARLEGERAFGELGVRTPVVGLSPGAAYGNAKRWLPERFAEAAVLLARELKGSVVVFGSGAEQPLCETVAGAVRASGVDAWNVAGGTSLRQFIDMAAACRVFLTNDSGAMHISSALGVPMVAVFGATDDIATGPTGANARVVREPVDCSPCLLRECPIDHRCMTRVSAVRVAQTALELLK
jgi:heptosyltransferase II